MKIKYLFLFLGNSVTLLQHHNLNPQELQKVPPAAGAPQFEQNFVAPLGGLQPLQYGLLNLIKISGFSFVVANDFLHCVQLQQL